MRHVVTLLLATSVACSLGLDVPGTVDVLCETSADCPDGEVCAPTGRCVAELETTPLTLLAASARNDSEIELIFSQPLVVTVALDLEHYAITPALGIRDAYSRGASTIVLRTDPQALGTQYTVRANGLIGSGGSFLDDAAASATFLGFGVPSDPTPPEALSPANGALVVGATQLLVWTPRVGAGSYTVVLARDAECTVVIDEQVVPATLTSHEVTLPSTGMFHWCVKADVTTAGQQGRATFNATDDAIYVRCLQNDACDFTNGEVGSPNAPFRSIQRAVAAAQQYGLSTVRIATRGSGAYAEVVQIAGRGIDLDGGYALDFASRDPVTNPTTLRFASSVLVITDVRTPMLVRGLRFEATDTQSTVAVLVSGTTSPVTLRDVRVMASGAYPVAVAIAESRDVALESSLVTTTAGGVTVGVRVQGATSLRVVASTVLAGEGQYGSDAIVAEGDGAALSIASSVVMSGRSTNGTVRAVATEGLLTLRDSRVVARQGITAYGVLLGSGTVERNAIMAEGNFLAYGLVLAAAPTLVRGNVIVEASAGLYSAGILVAAEPDCSGANTVRIVANTVVADIIALALRRGSPIITNNLLYAQTPVSELAQGVVSSDGADPLSFENNALIGTTAYIITGPEDAPNSGAARDLGDATQVNAINGMPCLGDTKQTVRYSGNITGEDSLPIIFADVDGPDNLYYEVGDDTVYETADNDFRLRPGGDSVGAYQGGKDATQSTCGDGTLACDGEATDLAGRPRTVPWSIGAYELD